MDHEKRTEQYYTGCIHGGTEWDSKWAESNLNELHAPSGPAAGHNVDWQFSALADGGNNQQQALRFLCNHLG